MRKVKDEIVNYQNRIHAERLPAGTLNEIVLIQEANIDCKRKPWYNKAEQKIKRERSDLITDDTIRNYFIEARLRHRSVSDAIDGKNTTGYPTAGMNIMGHDAIAHLSGRDDYKKNPTEVYRAMQAALGAEFIDQWIPDNPLSMGERGFQNAGHNATTGAQKIIVDGMEINSPEDVVEHMERYVFPRLETAAACFDHERRVREIGLTEYNIAQTMGGSILKTGYAFIGFPCMRYFTYGYENYFAAYALYPEVMERDFAQQAKLAKLNNAAAAEAYSRYSLPPLNRLDHDMTDSRGTLVDIKSMAKIWFPYLYESLEPMLDSGAKMIWHCDGNIMPMVPYLIECGIQGFQGFQYEDGVDFKKLCLMRTRGGTPLFIWAGISVTRTLPFGNPQDIAAEFRYLVENHGDAVLVLGASSSVTPGVSIANIDALVQGLRYYRTHLK